MSTPDFSCSTPDGSALSDLEGPLDRNINSIISMLESPAQDNDRLPSTQLLDQRVLKDVIAYVEVRSHTDNRSRAVEKQLQLLGARIEKKLTDDVTHVVFKDGKKSTRDRARKKGKHVVSVLWVDSCKQNQNHVSENLFQVMSPNKPGTPLAFARLKKAKSMQPKDFDEELALSAERVEKRRKKIEKMNKFKGLPLMITPTSPHQSRILVEDTQPRSPDEYYTPTITIPDTPPSMREKMKYLRTRRSHGSEEKSPLSPAIEASPPLQRQLFSAESSPSSTNPKSRKGSMSSNYQSPEVFTTGTDTNPDTEKKSNEKPRVTKPRRKKLLASQEGVQMTDSPADPARGSNSLAVTKASSSSKRKRSPQSESAAAAKKPKKQRVTAKDQQLSKSTSDSKIQSFGGNDDDDDDDKIDAESHRGKAATNRGRRKSCAPRFTGIQKRKGSEEGVGLRRSGRKSCGPDSSLIQNGDSVPAPQLDTPDVHDRNNRKVSINSTIEMLRADQTDVSTSVPQVTFTEADLTVNQGSRRKSRRSKVICSSTGDVSVDENVMSSSVDESSVADTDKVQLNCTDAADVQDCTLSNSLQTSHIKDKASSRLSVAEFMDSNHRGKMSKSRTSKQKQSQALSKGNAKKLVNVDHSSTLPKICVTNDDEISVVSDEKPVRKRRPGRRKTIANTQESVKCSSSTSPKDCTEIPVRKSRRKSTAVLSGMSLSASLLTDSLMSVEGKEINTENTVSVRRSPRQKSPAKLAGKKPSLPANTNPKTVRKSKSVCVKRAERSGSSSTEDEKPKKKQRWKTANMLSVLKAVPGLPSIVLTNLHTEERETAASVVQSVGGFYISDTVCDSTTHVVSGSDRRTLNVLYAITRGLWLLSLEWVLKSLEAGHWLEEEPYEQYDIFPAAQESRLERVASSQPYQQNLFEEFGQIYVSEKTAPPSDHLVKLLQLCSAQVTTNQRVADICVGISGKCDKPNVTEKWVLDCITSHAALSYEPYLKES